MKGATAEAGVVTVKLPPQNIVTDTVITFDSGGAGAAGIPGSSFV